MHRIFLLSVMLLLLGTPMCKVQAAIGIVPLWARPDPQSVLWENANARFLVQTVVSAKSKVKSADGTFALTFTITEVYWGSDALIGMTFEGSTGTEYRYAFSPESERRFPPPAPLDEGDRRICILIYDNDNDLLLSVRPRINFGFDFPVSDKEQPLYKEALIHAKAIQKLRGLNREAQVDLLKQYAEKGDLPIALWSLSTLSLLKDEKPATVVFLKQLLEAPQREIQIQTRIEESLYSLQSKEWRNSSQRIALFKRWLDGNHDSHSWYFIYSRLDTLTQDQLRSESFNSDLNQPTSKLWIFNSLATLVDKVVVTDDWDVSSVIGALSSMSKLAQSEPADQMELRNRVFNLLIQRIKNPKGFKADSLQLSSANQLDSFTQLSAAQIAEIVALQKENTNQKVSALLQKMLEKRTEPVDKPKTTVID